MISEWPSPVVLITKKDGSHNFYCFYRKFSLVTCSVLYSLPRTEDVRLGLGLGLAKFSCTMDAGCGFWCIPILKRPKKKKEVHFQLSFGLLSL